MNPTPAASYDELREVLALVRSVGTEDYALLRYPNGGDPERLLNAALVLLRTLASDSRLNGCANEIDRLMHLVIEYEARTGREAS